MTDQVKKPLPSYSLAAFFAIGFRPFYLLGAIYAAVSLVLWTGYLFDQIELRGPFEGVLWHSHELIFGFAAAILVGFLLTAVRNWTGLPTPSGWWLAALVLVWLLGRYVVTFASGPIVPLVDMAFLPLAALSIGVPLIKSRNKRNYFTFLLMLVLAVFNGLFYAVAYGWLEMEARDVFLVCVDVFAIFITIIGGRIIPLFANNATGSKRAQRHQMLEHVIVAGMVVLLVSDLVFGLSDQASGMRAILLVGLAILHGIKMVAWRPQITLVDPILWILPLAYAWIPISLALRAWALAGGAVDQILALHALTVGAMGGMMLAMMTRSALGHTGRRITASWAETAMFVLITLGAVIRVFGPIVVPQFYLLEIALSALCWVLAFGLFSARYLGIVMRPRL